MGRNPRSAGARFERRIATDLRNWLGPAWKVTRNQTDRQKGQVEGCSGEFTIEGPHRFPFSIECKDGSGFEAAHLMRHPVPGPLSSTGSREGFWAQACRQAASTRQYPMLVFRPAGSAKDIYVALESTGSIFTATQGPLLRITVDDDDDLYVHRWDQFLKTDPINLSFLYTRQGEP